MHAHRADIHFPATSEGFAQGFERLLAALDAQRLDAALRYNTELVFEEIVDNIVSHGHVPDGELDVRVQLEIRADAIVLTFEDNGVAFDPRGCAEPPRQQSLETARIGGYGLMLVHRAASSLDYERTAGGRNRLTVTLLRPRS